MVTTGIIYIAAGFLNAIAAALSIINIAVPVEVSQGITFFVAQVGMFQGVFPVDTLMAALTFLVYVFAAVYSVKLVLFLYHLMPFVGKKVSLPKHK